MTKIVAAIYLMFLSVLLISCSGDDDSGQGNSRLTLDVIGLQALPSTSEYEAWIVVNGNDISLGRFTDLQFPKIFNVNGGILDDATAFKLSIEPGNDPNPNISSSVILSGNFSGNAATLSMTEAIGDFSNAWGRFVLETPTDNTNGIDNGNDEAGIYWYNPSVVPASRGLNLPDLPQGWKYEGWVSLPTPQGTKAVSTGTFSSSTGEDDFAPFSGNQPAPDFPGEDFLNNSVAPDGVSFPPNLVGKDVFITIEPFPDTERAPFFLKPLVGVAGEVSPTINEMTLNTASFPLGAVARD